MAHIFLSQLKAILDNCIDELEQIHFLFSRNPEVVSKTTCFFVSKSYINLDFMGNLQ